MIKHFTPDGTLDAVTLTPSDQLHWSEALAEELYALGVDPGLVARARARGGLPYAVTFDLPFQIAFADSLEM